MGDWIRPGDYAVQARYARSVLLMDKSRRVLFVVDPSIGAGPLNLVVADPHAFVAATTLSVPRRAPAPRFDSAMPRLDGPARARLRRMLATALPRYAPAESLISLYRPTPRPARLQQARDARFQTAFARIGAGHLAAGVRLIRGCGEGLTPAGDDFLCGWMLACRLCRQMPRARRILRSARGQNAVANAFLELAVAGRVNAALRELLRAPTPAGVKRVCAFGHTSGADLLCGLRFGLGYSESGIQNRWKTWLTPAPTIRPNSSRCDTSRSLPACGAR